MERYIDQREREERERERGGGGKTGRDGESRGTHLMTQGESL